MAARTKRLVMAGLTMALAAGAMAVPAGAAAGRVVHSGGPANGVVIGGIVAEKKQPPSVAIKGATARFHPTSVTATKVSEKRCSMKTYSFAIGNLTTHDQQIQFTAADGGGDFGPAIPPDDALLVCISKAGNYGPTFTLESNTATTLSIDITKP